MVRHDNDVSAVYRQEWVSYVSSQPYRDEYISDTEMKGMYVKKKTVKQ